MRTLTALVFFVATCTGASFGQYPRGYWQHGRDVAKVQRQIFGLKAWSSVLLAQIEQESGWRACPISPVGARGLTQFMPGTQAAVERQYGVRGDVCDPKHAALLQSYLMRDNARLCGSRIRGWVPQWACSLRTYNGSPRNFWREWEAAGRPCCDTLEQERFCTRFRKRAHCIENIRYWRVVLARWPKYAQDWGA